MENAKTSVVKHDTATLTWQCRLPSLLTLLNRYGRCQSCSMTVELETAMANQVQQQNNILPSNLVLTGNKVSHLCWDNFDVNEETHLVPGPLIPHMAFSFRNCKMTMSRSKTFLLTKQKQNKRSINKTYRP